MTDDAELTNAWKMWKHYNEDGYGYEVAFQNGKLISFRDGSENVTDDQVADALRILNEDYSNNSKDFLESTIFKETFEEHFTDLDKSYINDYEPKIYFINENIYYDDTIETIKFKFLKHYNNLATNNDVDKLFYEEIYLFGLTNKPFDPIEIYDNLTINGKNKLKKENLHNYLINVNEQIKIMTSLQDKEVYDYNDLYDLYDDSFFSSFNCIPSLNKSSLI